MSLVYHRFGQNQFSLQDPSRDIQFSFHSVEYETDLERIHQWMHQEHVIPFWQLNLPIEKFSQHLQKSLADKHQQLYIGSLNQTPMSYWETYWVQGDVLEDYYDLHPDDQGIHLLIGEPDYLGKGYAYPMLRAVTYHLLQHSACEKVVAEPDIRNQKMIHIFEKCGFVMKKRIQLPDKEAALMFCEREHFLRSW